MKNLFFLLFLLFIVPVLDLFHPGLPVTHDGVDHVARIANFYQNLQQGIIVPRWAPNLDWGYGHPILEFLYPLPSYVASFFHFIGFSFVDSTKIILGLGLVLSGLTMYMWISSFANRKAAFVGCILYVFAPYRFVEVYVRGDVGENLAFVFIPLVLFFVYRVCNKPKTKEIALGSLSLAGLILAHNAISLMFVPFIIIYAFCLLYTNKKDRKQFYFNFLLLFVLGFGIAAFFWIPALLEGKFTLRNIVTDNIYKTRFVTLQRLLYGPWSYGGTGLFTVQLGVIQWISLATSILLLPILWVKSDKQRTITLVAILFTLFAVFLMLDNSDFIWSRIILLQNFQFPWRFLAVTVFTTAFLGGVVFSFVPQRMQTLMLVVIVFFILLLNKDYWHANGFLQKPESFFTGIYNGTTDTGESAPIWSVRFMEHKPNAPIEVITGDALIYIRKRTVTDHEYKITAKTETRLVENTLYFPGWQVKVDGKKVPIEFQDQKYRGLMTFFVSPGSHSIQITFRENALRFLSDMISLISICIIGYMSFYYRKK